MRKLVTACVTVASLLSAQSLSAQVLTSPGTWMFQGTVTLQKATTTIDCIIGVTMTIPNVGSDGHGAFPHGHSVTSADISVASGDPDCAYLSIDSNSHAVTLAKVSSTTFVIFKDVEVSNAITGSMCLGDVATEFKNSPDRLEANTIVPGPSVPCLMSGTLWLVWPADVDIII